MRILFASSEVEPFVREGELGGVVGALLPPLAARGHETAVVLPGYPGIDLDRWGFEVVSEDLRVRMEHTTRRWRVLESRAVEGVRVFLLKYDDLFDRPGVYGEHGCGYLDNGFRFTVYCKAVLQFCRDVYGKPSVIHVHDWPTAATAALLKVRCGCEPRLRYTGSVLSIHSLAHKGLCGHDVFKALELPYALWDSRYFEEYGHMNILKGGIGCADLVATTSPTYAREVLTPEGGNGLDAHFRLRQHDLHGILEGVDYRAWDPATDPALPRRYDRNDLEGRAACKADLLRAFGLGPAPEAPLFGVVSPLDSERGIDFVVGILGELVDRGARLVVLGSGDSALESALLAAKQRWPEHIGVRIGHDEALHRRVLGGSDFVLLPARSDSRGKASMYAQRYGALPVARSVGALADTVVDADDPSGQGTGFRFQDPRPAALLEAVDRALACWHANRSPLQRMVRRAMVPRFTWDRAAERYEQLYAWAVAKRYQWPFL